ncbi:TRAP transporter substrate-binding protein [Seohaeicola saemankumensis]|nr:TRAP transporter substrate-binding protein [Seohaeicola saemankumensis]MCA0872983.1 TRAP transporter substrate-binding protein [Seohaeicola saemankumensis]
MTMTTPRKIFAAAVAAGLAVAATTASAEWKGWNIHVPDYPVSVAMDDFIAKASEVTGGAVSGKTFHGGVLGSQPDAITQMQIGGINYAVFNMGPMGPIVPETNVLSLPFIFKDMDHMHRVMDGAFGDKLGEAMAAKGLVPLAWYDSGARSFYNSQKPINTPSDLDGMKFRVMNNELFVGMVEALGGNATPMAFSEVYQSLKTGVVDGAENNWPSYESTNHYEVAGYYSLSQHLILPECLCVSKASWDQLSAEDQAKVRKVARDSADLQRKLWADRAKASQAKVLESGVKFNEIADKAPFQDAMSAVYTAAIAKTPELEQLIADIKAVD